jgi:hypothetical protein
MTTWQRSSETCRRGIESLKWKILWLNIRFACQGLIEKVSVLLDMLTASKLDLLEFQARVMNLTLEAAAKK